MVLSLLGMVRGEWPLQAGDGYLLDLVIPLSGEECNILLGQLDQAESDEED